MACKDACAGLERMRSRIKSDTMGLCGCGITAGIAVGAALCVLFGKDVLEELSFEVLEALTEELIAGARALELVGFCALEDALDDAPELEALGMLSLCELDVWAWLVVWLALQLVLQEPVEGTLGAPQELGPQRSLCAAELEEVEELREELEELHEVAPELEALDDGALGGGPGGNIGLSIACAGGAPGETAGGSVCRAPHSAERWEVSPTTVFTLALTLRHFGSGTSGSRGSKQSRTRAAKAKPCQKTASTPALPP